MIISKILNSTVRFQIPELMFFFFYLAASWRAMKHIYRNMTHLAKKTIKKKTHHCIKLVETFASSL